LTLLLGLPLVLSSDPPTCAPLALVAFDNTTIPRLLGQWYYIAAASRYPPYQAEMKAVTYEAFSLSPGSHEDELNITSIIRYNDTCVMRNSSKVEVLPKNSTLLYIDDNQLLYKPRLIQSHEDLMILEYIDTGFPSLSISARTPNVSKEHMEEFKTHLHCLGFTEEDIFYAS
ncbi:A1AG protein, partial [Furnarius figulus]|nr:A1AG protein [Furnarius figulus]